MNGERGRLGHRPYLSCAPPDRLLARQLVAALRARGLDPWFDEEQLIPGDVVESTIRHGIAESTSMIVLCTSTSPSERQQGDWDRARELDKPVVPVLLGEAALPGPLAGLVPVVSDGVSEELADALFELSGDAIELGPPPPGLQEALNKGELVVFVGLGWPPGPATPCGPNW